MELKKCYAEVIVNISHEALDRTFEYIIPPSLQGKINEGTPVIIPFGKGNKETKGYVVGISDRSVYDAKLLKEIISVDDKDLAVEDRMINLASWMHHRYGSTMINCLHTVLPVRSKVKERVYYSVRLCISDEELETHIKAASANPRFYSRYLLLNELRKASSIPMEMLTGKLGVSASVVKTLEKHGIVCVDTNREYRMPVIHSDYADKSVTLSDEQQKAYENILGRMNSDKPGVTLLHGVTGSGKTEVYMRLIAECLNKGRRAIVLIPEIALTFQTLMRFYARFGQRVSVIHSRLSKGERFDQYEKVKNGEIDIIIGPRSALFMPVVNLGIIIIDEEHEGAYKSEKMPKYHAREVAEYICERENALLLLGSATPSVDSYNKAKSGDYSLEILSKRSNGAAPPRIHTVDMREELKKGNKSYFSSKLRELFTEKIMRGEQAMFFINRRGYAGFVSCRECGFVMKCPHCDVSMTEHTGNRMVCHYCGHVQVKPDKCPKCGSRFFAGFRAGTQKIEQEIHKIYPSVSVLRMDADTTSSKEDYEKILSAFASGEADVLVGTQMIVKGHDFPNVTLVGVLAADISLYSSDFRAGERTFQLILQAAGRAGRGDKKGDVVIQTYKPEEYALVHAATGDYEGFYEEEMTYRLLSDYPPAGHMMALQFFGQNEEYKNYVAGDVAEKIRKRQKATDNYKDMVIIGPADALVAKINDIYRSVIYIKYKDISGLIEIKDYVEQISEVYDKNRISIQFDIDPIGAF